MYNTILWLSNYIGFALSIVVHVSIIFFLLLPLSKLCDKNTRKKRLVAKKVDAVRKKYGMNVFGDASLKVSKEIEELGPAKREELTAQEISNIYKEIGYNPLLASFIPTVLRIVFCVFISLGTKYYPPEFATNLFSVFSAKWTPFFVITISIAVLSFLSTIITLAPGFSLKGKPKKAKIISAFLIVFQISLSCWFCLKMSATLEFALLTNNALSLIFLKKEEG